MYEKFGENTKRKMLRNLWVAINDAKEMALAFAKNCTCKAYIQEKHKLYDELFGKLSFVYLTTTLKVEDEAYQKICNAIFDISGKPYSELKNS